MNQWTQQLLAAAVLGPGASALIRPQAVAMPSEFQSLKDHQIGSETTFTKEINMKRSPFRTGRFSRSRLAQVTAAVWLAVAALAFSANPGRLAVTANAWGPHDNNCSIAAVGDGPCGALMNPSRLTGAGPHPAMRGFAHSERAALPTGHPRLGLAGIPVAARGAVSAGLGRDDPAYRLSGLHANNPVQRLGLSFSRDGASISSGGAHVRLSLAAYGYAGAMRHLPTASPIMLANRAIYEHGAVREWYTNGPLGLEQGFDLAARPRASSGPLTLSVALSGNVRARLDHGSVLLAASGAQLSYGNLVVTDARGHTLHCWLRVAGNRILIRVADDGAAYPLHVDPLVQVAELTASDPNFGDALGSAVAVSGDTIVVGAPWHNGLGAVYVFVKHGFLGWLSAKQTAELTASDGVGDDELGYSVAIDGDTVVAGAPGGPGEASRGRVYVWVKPASGWMNATETAELTASDPSGGDHLGQSVAVSGDTIAAGAPFHRVGNSVVQGSVYVFVKPASGWMSGIQTAELTASDGAAKDELGYAVAMAGETVFAGAPSHTSTRGAVYVFVEPPSGWANGTQTAELTASDAYPGGFLGYAVAAYGDTVVASGVEAVPCCQDQAYVFVKPTSGWVSGTQTALLSQSSPYLQDLLGAGIAISGDTVVAGAPSYPVGTNVAQGALFVWVKPASGWMNKTQTAVLTAYDGVAYDALGFAAGADGGTVVTGAPRAGYVQHGKAYVFGPVPFWWLSYFLSHLSCFSLHDGATSAAQACVLVTWRAPQPLLPYLAGFNLYSGKHRLNKRLVASETDTFQLKIHGTHKHLRAVPVLGVPPACITGGPFTSTFDGKLGRGWQEHIPQAGPKFSLKGDPSCLRLTVPKTGPYDVSGSADNAPELLQTPPAGAGWTATTRLTLSKLGKASAGSAAPAGFQTGMVLRLPNVAGTQYPTQLSWGLYRPGSHRRPSLRLDETGSPGLVNAPGAPKTVELRITYAPANCAYNFWYEFPGQTVFSDSRYTYNSCAQGAQVGLITRTFGSPIKVTTDFDWFDLRSS
jgi:FG-GAP repeat